MGKALPGYHQPHLNTHTLWPCPRGTSPSALAQKSISGPGRQNSRPRVEHITASLRPKRGRCHWHSAAWTVSTSQGSAGHHRYLQRPFWCGTFSAQTTGTWRWGGAHASPLTSPGHNDTQNTQKGNKQAQSLNNRMLIQFNQDDSIEEHSTTKCSCDSFLTLN